MSNVHQMDYTIKSTYYKNPIGPTKDLLCTNFKYLIIKLTLLYLHFADNASRKHNYIIIYIKIELFLNLYQ